MSITISQFPTSVAYDPLNGILFQTDITQNVIYYISATRGSGIIAGNGITGSEGDGKQGVFAQLNRPINIAYNNGKLYIADYNNSKIRVIDLGSRLQDFPTTTNLPRGLLPNTLITGTPLLTTTRLTSTSGIIPTTTAAIKRLTCEEKPLCFIKNAPQFSIEPIQAQPNLSAFCFYKNTLYYIDGNILKWYTNVQTTTNNSWLSISIFTNVKFTSITIFDDYIFVVDKPNNIIYKSKLSVSQSIGGFDIYCGKPPILCNTLIGAITSPNPPIFYSTDVDLNGTLYMTANDSVYKYDKTTLTMIVSGLNQPLGIAYYSPDNVLFVADKGNNRICKITLNNNQMSVYTTITISDRCDLTIIADRLYFTTTNEIRMIYLKDVYTDPVPSTPLTTAAITTTGRPATIPTITRLPSIPEKTNVLVIANVNNPSGLFFDAISSYLYIADTGNNRICRVNILKESPYVLEQYISNINSPRSIAIDNNNMFISMGPTIPNTIRFIKPTTTLPGTSNSIASSSSTPVQFMSIMLSESNNILHTIVMDNNTIATFNTTPTHILLKNSIAYVNDGSKLYAINYNNNIKSSDAYYKLETSLVSPISFDKNYFIEESGSLCKIDISNRIQRVLGNGFITPNEISIQNTSKPSYTANLNLGTLTGLFVDKNNNVYICCQVYGCIIRITDEGAIQPITGGFKNNSIKISTIMDAKIYPAYNIDLETPESITMDDTNTILYCTCQNKIIKVFDLEANEPKIQIVAGILNSQNVYNDVINRNAAYSIIFRPTIISCVNNVIRFMESSKNRICKINPSQEEDIPDNNLPILKYGKVSYFVNENIQYVNNTGYNSMSEKCNTTTATFDENGNMYYLDKITYSIKRVDMQGNISTIFTEEGAPVLGNLVYLNNILYYTKGITPNINIASYNILTNSLSSVYININTPITSYIIDIFINTYLVFVSNNNILFYSLINQAITSLSLFDTRSICIDNINILYCIDSADKRIIKRYEINILNNSIGLTPMTSLTESTQISYEMTCIRFNPLDSNYIYYTNNMGQVKKRPININAGAATGSDILVCGGNRTGYSTNGTYPTSTYLMNPIWLIFDYRNNMYIIDQIEANMTRILKLESFTLCFPNHMYNIAGNGIRGFAGDGQDASYSQINNVNGVSHDKYGNIYLADTGNNRIRRISIKTGFIETLFILNEPIDVKFDSTNTMYIACKTNILSSQYNITTDTFREPVIFAGTNTTSTSITDGQSILNQIPQPYQLFVDKSNSVYFLSNKVVYKISIFGYIQTFYTSTAAINSFVIDTRNIIYTAEGGQIYSKEFVAPIYSTTSTDIVLGIDSSNKIYFYTNGTIQRLGNNGQTIKIAGELGKFEFQRDDIPMSGMSGDNNINSILYNVKYISINSDNNILFSQTNSRVRSILYSSTPPVIQHGIQNVQYIQLTSLDSTRPLNITEIVALDSNGINCSLGKPAVTMGLTTTSLALSSFIPTGGWYGALINAYNSYNPIRIDLGKPYEIIAVLCYFNATSAPFKITLYDASGTQLTERRMTLKPPFTDPFEHFDFKTFQTYKTRSEILSSYLNQTPQVFYILADNTLTNTADAERIARQNGASLATFTNLMEDIRDPLLSNMTGWVQNGIRTMNSNSITSPGISSTTGVFCYGISPSANARQNKYVRYITIKPNGGARSLYDTGTYKNIKSRNNTIYKLGSDNTLIYGATQIPNILAFDIDNNNILYTIKAQRLERGLQDLSVKNITDGNATTYTNPVDIAINSNDIYVATSSNINKVSQQLCVSRIKSSSTYNRMISDSAGNIYISTSNGSIIKIDTNGTETTLCSGLNNPNGMVIKDGILYIAETGHNRIGKISITGGTYQVHYTGYTSPAGSTLSLNFTLSSPMGLCLDSNRNIIVVDSNGCYRLNIESINARDPPSTAELSYLTPTRHGAFGKLYITSDNKIYTFNGKYCINNICYFSKHVYIIDTINSTCTKMEYTNGYPNLLGIDNYNGDTLYLNRVPNSSPHYWISPGADFTYNKIYKLNIPSNVNTMYITNQPFMGLSYIVFDEGYSYTLNGYENLSYRSQNQGEDYFITHGEFVHKSDLWFTKNFIFAFDRKAYSIYYRKKSESNWTLWFTDNGTGPLNLRNEIRSSYNSYGAFTPQSYPSFQICEGKTYTGEINGIPQYEYHLYIVTCGETRLYAIVGDTWGRIIDQSTVANPQFIETRYWNTEPSKFKLRIYRGSMGSDGLIVPSNNMCNSVYKNIGENILFTPYNSDRGGGPAGKNSKEGGYYPTQVTTDSRGNMYIAWANGSFTKWRYDPNNPFNNPPYWNDMMSGLKNALDILLDSYTNTTEIVHGWPDKMDINGCGYRDLDGWMGMEQLVWGHFIWVSAGVCVDKDDNVYLTKDGNNYLNHEGALKDGNVPYRKRWAENIIRKGNIYKTTFPTRTFTYEKHIKIMRSGTTPLPGGEDVCLQGTTLYVCNASGIYGSDGSTNTTITNSKHMHVNGTDMYISNGNQITKRSSGNNTLYTGSNTEGNSGGSLLNAIFKGTKGFVITNNIPYVLDGNGLWKIQMEYVNSVVVSSGTNNPFAVNSTSIYISTQDGSGPCVKKIQHSTNAETRIGGFSNPRGVFVNSDGNIYVADSNNNCIYLINNNDNTLTTFITNSSTTSDVQMISPIHYIRDTIGQYILCSTNIIRITAPTTLFSQISVISKNTGNNIMLNANLYGANIDNSNLEQIKTGLTSQSLVPINFLEIDLGKEFIIEYINYYIKSGQNINVTLEFYNEKRIQAMEPIRNYNLQDSVSFATNINSVNYMIQPINPVTYLKARYIDINTSSTGKTSQVVVINSIGLNVALMRMSGTNNPTDGNYSNKAEGECYTGSFTIDLGTEHEIRKVIYYSALNVLTNSTATIRLKKYTTELTPDTIPITRGRIISTIAGSGTAGSENGIGTAASFNAPGNLCIDFAGNIYVADQASYAIRKITPQGVVSTFISGQTNVVGLAISPDGTTLYWSNWSGQSVFKCNISTPGTIITLATLGSAFQPVNSIAVNADNTMLYLTEPNSNRIIALSTNANNLTNFTASGVTPALIWCAGNGAASIVNAAGSAARFNGAVSIALGPNGNLYIADYHNNAIRMMTPLGAQPTPLSVTTFAGNGTAGLVDGVGTNARFNGPTGVTFDKDGNLYVTDARNNRIRIITPAGAVSTIAGTGTGMTSTDGPIGTATMYNPTALIIDASDNIIFSERTNPDISVYATNRIRKITPCIIAVSRPGALGSMSGMWVGGPFAITHYYPVWSGSTLSNVYFFTYSGVHTKIVDWTGKACYYEGSLAVFNPSNISTYSTATPGYIYVPPVSPGNMSGPGVNGNLPIAALTNISSQPTFMAIDNAGTGNNYIKFVSQNGANWYIANTSYGLATDIGASGNKLLSGNSGGYVVSPTSWTNLDATIRIRMFIILYEDVIFNIGGPAWGQYTIKQSLIPSTLSFDQTFLAGSTSVTTRNRGTWASNDTYRLGHIVLFTDGFYYINLAAPDQRGVDYSGTHGASPTTDLNAWKRIQLSNTEAGAGMQAFIGGLMKEVFDYRPSTQECGIVNLGPSSPLTGIRYIRYTPKEKMAIRQIVVYDKNGRNVALGKGTTLAESGATRITDGTYSLNSPDTQLYPTTGLGLPNQTPITIDLGATYDITAASVITTNNYVLSLIDSKLQMLNASQLSKMDIILKGEHVREDILITYTYNTTARYIRIENPPPSFFSPNEFDSNPSSGYINIKSFQAYDIDGRNVLEGKPYRTSNTSDYQALNTLNSSSYIRTNAKWIEFDIGMDVVIFGVKLISSPLTPQIRNETYDHRYMKNAPILFYNENRAQIQKYFLTDPYIQQVQGITSNNNSSYMQLTRAGDFSINTNKTQSLNIGMTSKLLTTGTSFEFKTYGRGTLSLTLAVSITGATTTDYNYTIRTSSTTYNDTTIPIILDTLEDTITFTITPKSTLNSGYNDNYNAIQSRINDIKNWYNLETAIISRKYSIKTISQINQCNLGGCNYTNYSYWSWTNTDVRMKLLNLQDSGVTLPVGSVIVETMVTPNPPTGNDEKGHSLNFHTAWASRGEMKQTINTATRISDGLYIINRGSLQGWPWMDYSVFSWGRAIPSDLHTYGSDGNLFTSWNNTDSINNFITNVAEKRHHSKNKLENFKKFMKDTYSQSDSEISTYTIDNLTTKRDIVLEPFKKYITIQNSSFRYTTKPTDSTQISLSIKSDIYSFLLSQKIATSFPYETQQLISTGLTSVQYLYFSTETSSCSMSELVVIDKRGINVAAGKPIILTSTQTINSVFTNGKYDINTSTSFVLDLGAPYDISTISMYMLKVNLEIRLYVYKSNRNLHTISIFKADNPSKNMEGTSDNYYKIQQATQSIPLYSIYFNNPYHDSCKPQHSGIGTIARYILPNPPGKKVCVTDTIGQILYNDTANDKIDLQEEHNIASIYVEGIGTTITLQDTYGVAKSIPIPSPTGSVTIGPVTFTPTYRIYSFI